MLNRRFLRVKALQSIYAYHQSESSNLSQAERQLLEGVDNLYITGSFAVQKKLTHCRSTLCQ